MGEQSTPDMIDASVAPALRDYLAWHALASEFMCGVVARGIPLAPTRDQRRALMHQIRTENTQAHWLVSRVEELGGEVPEQDPSLLELQGELIALCDQSWLDYLACAQVAMRGYMSPYLRAVGTLIDLEDQHDGFSPDTLVPEIASHFQRSLTDLRSELTALTGTDRAAALDEARRAEGQAFDIFRRFIATSYPMLGELGVDTAGLERELVAERQRFWDRLGASLDAVA